MRNVTEAGGGLRGRSPPRLSHPGAMARQKGHDSKDQQPSRPAPRLDVGDPVHHQGRLQRGAAPLHHGARPSPGQINSCSPCVYSGAISAKKAGESDERLFAVAAWRETDLFTEAERAALALAESMTRLADRTDAVPDDVWGDAAEHFDEKQLAGLVLWIATTNLFNRINTATRQPAGTVW
jgi:AhpD family alkylhydroperoxidase